ncbi:MAG TPA: hypothetical protein VMZ91_09750 [Candidatus Paceibacterota bacterium]|nr:hypothetical protein [Candidatus Paceibacterota bacterium]
MKNRPVGFLAEDKMDNCMYPRPYPNVTKKRGIKIINKLLNKYQFKEIEFTTHLKKREGYLSIILDLK